MMLLLQTSPLLPIFSQGPVVGSAIICTGLFLWAQVEAYKSRRASDSLVSTFTTANGELKSMLTSQAEAQGKLANAVSSLASAMHEQTDMHREQLDLIREVMSEQKLQSQTMMSITDGFQRVVEQLIAVVKDKD